MCSCFFINVFLPLNLIPCPQINSFPKRLKKLNSLSSETPSGIDPESLLTDKSSICNDVKVEILEGITPKRLLLNNNNMVKLVKCPISLGIFPEKLQFEMYKY